MSFTLEKKVGKHVYFYKVTSYWDSDKKQPRQKREYLGKKDPHTGKLIPSKTPNTPRLSKDYGHIYLLKYISDDIGLTPILRETFPADYQELLALAFFELSEGNPLYVFPYWANITFLDSTKSLRSFHVTEFTQKIGEMETTRLEFSRLWVKQLGIVNAVVFDLTSISSYSQLFHWIEWGYNRDKERLPQINLGMLYAEERNLPFYDQIYPGSIHDVSTLQNMLHYLDLFHVHHTLCIMDKGFYSARNLSRLQQHQLHFLVPLPMTVSLFAQLIAQQSRHLTHLNNAFAFKDEILFHCEHPLEINHLPLTAHLYLSQTKQQEQRSAFLKKIFELEATVKQQEFKKKQEVLAYLKDAQRYFVVSYQEGQVVMQRKPQVLSRHMNHMGFTIMLSNQPGLQREHILLFYRQKDYLEKVFDTLKHECDGDRLRGSSKEAIEGRLFIKFLSLILHSSLCNKMRDNAFF
jgi:hypothetical protein